MVELIGYIAGLLTIVSYLPQVIKSWKTRETKDLSLGTGILLASAAISWTVYGTMLSLMPMMITNIIVFLCVLAVIAVWFFPQSS
ncbi:MAG: SemiSWEET family sugar transporter [Promethearchaeota archaeon]|jgi:MtN3 and saliva related transmembrane protein